VPDRDASGEVIGVYVMVMDVTARKWAELQQAESESRLRTITDNLPVLISFVDANGIVRFCNATYENWFGKEMGQLVGRPLREALGDATYAAQLAQFRAALGGERTEFDLDIAGPDGVRNARAIYVPQAQPDGRTAGVYMLTLDMTSIKRVEQELHRLARFDSLTALANRRQFDEHLPQAIEAARATGHPLALMFIDVDHFKAINDTLGHAGGDEVLQEFAWRLHAGVREGDLVARLAGDEFVILLEDVASEAEAEALAAKIVAAIREPFELVSGRRQVTASIGVAFVGGGELAAAEMMQLADQALYEAKAAGRDTARLAVHPGGA
jgi:diguanylate cyclase (GGDEF)-like protein/PAS domain S-box-containing protein